MLRRRPARRISEQPCGSGGAEAACDSDEKRIVEALMAELMSAFRPQGDLALQPLWLKRVLDALHDGTFKCSRELAHIAGVHPYHLAAVFQRFYGCTPAEYA